MLHVYRNKCLHLILNDSNESLNHEKFILFNFVEKIVRLYSTASLLMKAQYKGFTNPY